MLTVLREDSAIRARWDFAGLILVVVGCLLVPYQLAFQHQPHLIGSLIIYLIDLFFLIDIALSFRTSYRHQGIDVTDPEMIARRYRRGRFPIDLLAALPLDLLILPWSGFTIEGISIVLYVRLLRLLRLVRLFAIVREGEIANGIYFISLGTVEVLSEDGAVSHGTLEDGDYFGDLSLLLGERRTASVRAITFCDLLVLPKAEFERIKTEYPEFRNALKALSSERSEKISALVLSGAVL